MCNESAPLAVSEFSWWRPHPDYIAPLEGDILGVYSLEQYYKVKPDRHVYRELVGLVFEHDVPGAVYNFVRKWGFLGVGCNPLPQNLAYGEAISSWCAAAITLFQGLAFLPLATKLPKWPPVKRVGEGRWQINHEWWPAAKAVKELAKGRLMNKWVLEQAMKAPHPKQEVVFFDGDSLGTPAPPSATTKATEIRFFLPLTVQCNSLNSLSFNFLLPNLFPLLRGLEANVALQINPFEKAPHLTVHPGNLLGFAYLSIIEDLVAAYFPKGRYCAECGDLMRTPRLNKIYCSVRCRNRAIRKRKRNQGTPK